MTTQRNHRGHREIFISKKLNKGCQSAQSISPSILRLGCLCALAWKRLPKAPTVGTLGCG